jgi:hypothetical protein
MAPTIPRPATERTSCACARHTVLIRRALLSPLSVSALCEIPDGTLDSVTHNA